MRRFFHRFGSCRRSCRLLGGGIIGRQAKAMPGQTACNNAATKWRAEQESILTEPSVLLFEECNQRTWYLVSSP